MLCTLWVVASRQSLGKAGVIHARGGSYHPSGWRPATLLTGPRSAHILILSCRTQYKLVPADKLAAAEASFEPLTASHVYSLAASKSVTNADMSNLSQQQDAQLFDEVSLLAACLS